MSTKEEKLSAESQKVEDGSYIPSELALDQSTMDKTNYQPMKVDKPYTGNKKILMLCTEEKHLEVQNGKQFSTGNQPVEMLVPMLHLTNAGFDIDIATPHAKPVQIEKWAFPKEDEKVNEIYQQFQEDFQQPINLHELVKNKSYEDAYLALFIPGGHGALIGLPENEDVHTILDYFHHNDLHTLAICHGPAVFLAADSKDADSFIYQGYKIAAFPDSSDKQLPEMGYLPGQLNWFFGERLEKLGVEIVNQEADDTCHVDRHLITAASPAAANEFGKISVHALLEANA